MKVFIFFLPLIFALLLPICECDDKKKGAADHKKTEGHYSAHISAEIQFVDTGGVDAKTLGLYATETGGEPLSGSLCSIVRDFDKEDLKVKTVQRRKKQESEKQPPLPQRSGHVKRKSSDVEKRPEKNAAAVVRHAKCEINAKDLILTPKTGGELVIYLGVTDVVVPDDVHDFRIPITKLHSRKRVTQIQPKIGLTIHNTGKIVLNHANKKEINFWHKHLKHLFGSKDPAVDFAARFEF
ncbi:hypothetical protein Ddc_10145 [Ditylenchus destructor]|nr:hypothetical protein Ddc_10145 [Ditylenchus destructor]